MVILLLGSDDFSKKQYISALAKKHQAEGEFFATDDVRPNLGNFFGQDLFAKTKVVVLRGLLGGYEYEEDWVKNWLAVKILLFLRKKNWTNGPPAISAGWATKISRSKNLFLPHGTELDKWIISRAKDLGGPISKAAADLLAKKLGRDDAKETKFGGKVVDTQEIYNLWQADSEIQKLLAFAKGTEVDVRDVEQLVSDNSEVEAFDLTNAIADMQKQKAMELMNLFLKDQNSGDEKGSIIQLNALLSEQFRNVLMVQDFLARKISENQILEQTGWKSGRLFVIKKIAGRFKSDKVKDTLNKLAALDDELKTGSTPPKVLLDLIVSQLFV